VKLLTTDFVDSLIEIVNAY